MRVSSLFVFLSDRRPSFKWRGGCWRNLKGTRAAGDKEGIRRVRLFVEDACHYYYHHLWECNRKIIIDIKRSDISTSSQSSLLVALLSSPLVPVLYIHSGIHFSLFCTFFLFNRLIGESRNLVQVQKRMKYRGSRVEVSLQTRWNLTLVVFYYVAAAVLLKTGSLINVVTRRKENKKKKTLR